MLSTWLFRIQTTVNELGTLAATAVVCCTFTQDISDNENVGTQLKIKLLINALPPFKVVCIWFSVYHIRAYFMTYFPRLCFASVCSYNRDTRCSEARPLFKDSGATVQRQCSVSSSCSRPVIWVTSDSDQCHGPPSGCWRACWASIHDLRQMRRPPPMQWLQSPRAQWTEFQVNVSCNWRRPAWLLL